MGGKSNNQAAPPTQAGPLSAEAQSYLNRNPDVGDLGLDPWQHFNEYGQGEGRFWGLSSAEFDNDYLSRYPGVRGSGLSAFDHFNKYGRDEGRTYGAGPGGPFDPNQGFLDMIAANNAASAAAAHAAAGRAAELEAQREADRVTAGENSRDRLYGDYLSAGESATDYINGTITEEQANADLLGIEYSITDEQKQTRINDYFSSIWSEGDQTSLETLFKDFGNPEGFEDFLFTRGEDGSSEGTGAGTDSTPEAQETSSKKKRGSRAVTNSLLTSGGSNTLG